MNVKLVIVAVALTVFCFLAAVSLLKTSEEPTIVAVPAIASKAEATTSDLTMVREESDGTRDAEVEDGVTATTTPAKVLLVRDGALEVVVNATTNPITTRHVANVGSDGKFIIPSSIRRVFIEVGTNDEPEMTTMLKGTDDALLIAFEPQPAIYEAMVAKFPIKERLIAVPSAVAPSESFLTIYISEHRGCTSLLPMNRRASTFARKHKDKAPKKGVRIQLRTIEFCASQAHKLQIPAVPLWQVMDLIPTHLPIEVLMTDAQGFDTTVLSTVAPRHYDRIAFIVAECQDLEPGHQLFLVNGAPSCAQQQRCVEEKFPHRLDFCWDNAPKVRELNCLYRHPVHAPRARKLPARLKVVGGAKNISYDNPPPFACP